VAPAIKAAKPDAIFFGGYDTQTRRRAGLPAGRERAITRPGA
jgi:hypothetical protein